VTERYELIAAEKAAGGAPATVAQMCSWAEVSPSGFYAWVGRGASARARARVTTGGLVAAALAGRGTYGARRVRAVLIASGHPISLRSARSHLREQGLRACQPRAYRTTTWSDRAAAGPADRVRRDFTAPRPGVKLVGDITYIRTGQGWLYLATTIDCYSKMIVGWSMAEHMRTSLVTDAIEMAAGRGDLEPGCIFHSDRGTQYTSAELADHLRGLGMVGSMGRTGVCWDNAMAESFFSTLKNELVHRTIFETHDQARTAIAEYIEVFYNRHRIHSGIGYTTPAEMIARWQQRVGNAA
jgi:putative transposase